MAFAARPSSRCLHRSASFTVSDYRCAAHRGGAGAEECSSGASIVFVRRGLFVRHFGGETHAADANSVVFFSPGECYRVSHPADGGDDCSSFAPSRAVLDEALEAHNFAEARDRGGAFPEWQAPVSPHIFAVHRALMSAVARGECEDTEIDGHAIALLDRLIADRAAARGARPSRRRTGAATRRAHRELAESARVYLGAHRAERVTLDGVARAAHASPFHLARVFRAQTGLPVHRYLSRLRLRDALERISAGAPDLSRVALESGFFDHSHFTNAFRREFAVPPSAFKPGRDRVTLREMSKSIQV